MPRGRKKGSKNKAKGIKADKTPTLEELKAMVHLLQGAYNQILHEIRGELIIALHKVRQLGKVEKYMKEIGVTHKDFQKKEIS